MIQLERLFIFIYNMADITPQNQYNPFAQLEKDPGNKPKVSEKEEKRIDKWETIKKSPLWAKLKEVLWSENRDIYERILTLLSKYEWDISEEQVKKEINSLFSSEETIRQLWLSLNKSERSEIITLISKEFSSKGQEDNKEKIKNEISTEKIKESPSYPLLKRLESEWFVEQQEIDSVLKSISGKTQEEWDKILELFIKNSVEGTSNAWKDLKENILKWLSPKELTEENFSQSEFANDFQDSKTGKKPEFSDFHVLLWENYIKIPDKQGNSNKQKDFEMMFDKSLNKILQGQSGDFKKVNAEIIWKIKTSNNNNERYVNLQKLFTLSQTDTAKSLKWKEWGWNKEKENTESKNRLHELLKKWRDGAKANTEKNEKIKSIAGTIEEIEENNSKKAEELEKRLEELLKKENSTLEEYSDLLKDAKEAQNENNTGSQKKE